MGLAVGDVGSSIDLNIKEINTSGDEQDANFSVLDTVVFVMVFADGTRNALTGTFVTSSKARYTTTVSTDIAAAGRCEIQLQITTTDSKEYSSEIFVTTIEQKL